METFYFLPYHKNTSTKVLIQFYILCMCPVLSQDKLYSVNNLYVNPSFLRASHWKPANGYIYSKNINYLNYAPNNYFLLLNLGALKVSSMPSVLNRTSSFLFLTHLFHPYSKIIINKTKKQTNDSVNYHENTP